MIHLCETNFFPVILEYQREIEREPDDPKIDSQGERTIVGTSKKERGREEGERFAVGSR